MPEEKRKFKVADFVSKIVKDPNSPPNTLLLQGYLGDSSEKGHIRLYFDPQLSDYVEIPEDAILHTQEIPNAALGETYVWINQDAELTHGKAGPQRLKAKFLEGRIQQEFLGGAAATAGAVLRPPSFLPQLCPSAVDACPSRLCPSLVCPPSIQINTCHSAGRFCPSVIAVCQSIDVRCEVASVVGCPPSVPVNTCPPPQSLHRPICPSVVAVCQSIDVRCEVASVANTCPPPPSLHRPICPSVVAICQSIDVRCEVASVVGCPPSVPVNTCPPPPSLHRPICPSVVAICQSIDVRCEVESAACPQSIQINTCPSRIIVQCHQSLGWCPPSLPVYTCPSRTFIDCNQTIDPRTCVIDPRF